MQYQLRSLSARPQGLAIRLFSLLPGVVRFQRGRLMNREGCGRLSRGCAGRSERRTVIEPDRSTLPASEMHTRWRCQ